MNKEQFINIWELLFNYNKRSKELIKLNINLFEHDKELYTGIIMLLKVILENQAQVDFVIFSIFAKDKYIEELDDTIDTADKCWEYINNI